MPPSSDSCDNFSNILSSSVGVPQRNISGIKLDLASILLPDDPGTSEDDLISVLLGDIQRSSFDNFTDDYLSIYDSADSTFNVGSDEFDTMIAARQERTILGWSTMIATNDIDANYEGDNGMFELQSTKVAHIKPRAWANDTAAKQVDDLGYQVPSDLFHSMPPYIDERHRCGLVCPSIPLQQLHDARDVRQVPNYSSAEPRFGRSNRSSTNTRSSTWLSRKGDNIDDRRPSPEVIQSRAHSTRKRKNKSKPGSNTLFRVRSEDATVNSPQVPPSHTQSSPAQSSPIQEYLRPIRGRPCLSKTGEQQSSTVTPSTSAACDVLQLSSTSAPTTPLSEMPEKATKTRKKPRKIVKPNPYPDLSRYPPQRRSDARTDNDTIRDRPPLSSNSAGSSANIPLLPSTVFDFPSSKSHSFVLTHAKWNQPSRSSSTYTQACEDSNSSFANTSVDVDGNGRRGFEPDDQSLDYPVSAVAMQPLNLSLAWSMHSNDSVTSELKRKLASDYSEESEAGGSATRIMDALCDQPVETLGPPFTHQIYGYADPFTSIMQDYSYSLQMGFYRDVFARNGTPSSKDNDIGVWYHH